MRSHIQIYFTKSFFIGHDWPYSKSESVSEYIKRTIFCGKTPLLKEQWAYYYEMLQPSLCVLCKKSTKAEPCLGFPEGQNFHLVQSITKSRVPLVLYDLHWNDQNWWWGTSKRWYFYTILDKIMPDKIFLTDNKIFCLLKIFPIFLFQNGWKFLEVKKILSNIVLSDEIIAI